MIATLTLLLREDPTEDDPDAADRDSEGEQRASRGAERGNENVDDVRERDGRVVRRDHREEDEKSDARPEETLGRSHKEVQPLFTNSAVMILRRLCHVFLPRSWSVCVP